MSGDRPFAEVVPKVPPHRWACDVEIAGHRFGGRGLNRTTAASRVDNINAAVAARERKAAAKALREAAQLFRDRAKGHEDAAYGAKSSGDSEESDRRYIKANQAFAVVMELEARADQVEKGEA